MDSLKKRLWRCERCYWYSQEFSLRDLIEGRDPCPGCMYNKGNEREIIQLLSYQ